MPQECTAVAVIQPGSDGEDVSGARYEVPALDYPLATLIALADWSWAGAR